jgi:hypothetical protein
MAVLWCWRKAKVAMPLGSASSSAGSWYLGLDFKLFAFVSLPRPVSPPAWSKNPGDHTPAPQFYGETSWLWLSIGIICNAFIYEESIALTVSFGILYDWSSSEPRASSRCFSTFIWFETRAIALLKLTDAGALRPAPGDLSAALSSTECFLVVKTMDNAFFCFSMTPMVSSTVLLRSRFRSSSSILVRDSSFAYSSSSSSDWLDPKSYAGLANSRCFCSAWLGNYFWGDLDLCRYFGLQFEVIVGFSFPEIAR